MVPLLQCRAVVFGKVGIKAIMSAAPGRREVNLRLGIYGLEWAREVSRHEDYSKSILLEAESGCEASDAGATSISNAAMVARAGEPDDYDLTTSSSTHDE